MAGSGFVLFREDTISSPSPLMLALIRKDGIFDIPKGHKEKGEDDITTATRECFEECSVMVRSGDILYSPFTNGELTSFCASTNQTPTITKNPSSGLVEHAGWRWVTKDEFVQNCLSYLRPGVEYFYSEHSRKYNP